MLSCLHDDPSLVKTRNDLFRVTGWAVQIWISLALFRDKGGS